MRSEGDSMSFPLRRCIDRFSVSAYIIVYTIGACQNLSSRLRGEGTRADNSGPFPVSFAKAEQLLQLATLVAARHAGVTLDDVIARFSVSKRTAQRMLRALETQFAETTITMDDEGRRRWLLPSGALRDLMSLTPEELVALDIAVGALKRSGLAVEAEELIDLREKIVALVPRSKVARLETDHEALLEAQGLRRDRDHASESTAGSPLRSPKRSRPVVSWRSTISPAVSLSRACAGWHPTVC
jgi:hypothetical protein